MMKIRKRTVHSLKAVGGFFAGIELEIMEIERLKKIEKNCVTFHFFKRRLDMKDVYFFPKSLF